MPLKGKSFAVNTYKVESTIKTLFGENRNKEIKRRIKAKVDASTQLVFNLARTRRPDIKVGKRRVSDPSAKLGVPVRTGKLRSSIQKEVVVDGDKVIGRVFTEGVEYAEKIEFGSISKAGKIIPPRSFMGSALQYGKPEIEKIFKSDA